MSDYRRADVEKLLPAVWDEDFAYGVMEQNTPDPDMPRSSNDPSQGNTLYAMLADVRQAWRRVELTRLERRAVFLRFALGMTDRQLGTHEGVAHQVAYRRVETAVGKITAHLNGEAFCDGYGKADDDD